MTHPATSCSRTGVVGDAIDRIQRVGDFRLVGCKSVCIVDTGIRGVQRQASHFYQQAVDFVERAFGRLNNRNGFL